MSELVPVHRGPTVVHITHPLLASGRHVRQESGLVALHDLAPHTREPVVCTVNGEFVLRADWDLEAGPGDVVVFAHAVQGGGGDSNPLQVVLGIVLIVAGVFTGFNPYLIGAGFSLVVGGLIPQPSFTPLNPTENTAPSPTYSTTLGGNSARLGQAIPVPYGLHPISPDFAAQPYSEFDDTGDQYYHALLCLGLQERHSVTQIYIDDTPLNHFVGVQQQLIGPQYAASLTLVNPAVVNAPEIAQQDVIRGTVVGPFAACGPGLLATKIGVDIICPKGLFLADNAGEMQEKTISWYVEARKVTDSGSPAGAWTLLGNHTLTDNSNSPIRRTYTYTVPAGRYEVQMWRLDERDDNVRVGHDLQWLGLRAYLQVTAPLNPNAVYLALRIRANSQLSGLSQRRISVLQQRKLQSWHPDTGWGPYQDSRSIAWAVVDALKNPVYGAGVDDSRIDLQSFYELDLLWSSRGDYFDAVIDKRTTIWSVMQMMLRCGRAVPLMRGSVFTAVRDSKPELPVALFNMRNIRRGSFSLDYQMPNEDDPDGLLLEFFNRDTWATDYIKIAAPGVVGDPVSPSRVSLPGVVTRAQAQREGKHLVDDAYYRRSRVSFETELEGHLPTYGDPILVSHDVANWGRSGEIEEWASPLALCSEEPRLTGELNYAVLVDHLGDVYGPYKVGPGDGTRTLEFLELPAITPYTGTDRERTRYSVGPASNYAKLCRILNITPSEGNSVKIMAVIEDERMHSDAALVGGGGGGGRTARYAPNGIPNYNSASDTQQNSYGFYTEVDGTVGVANDEGYFYD